MLVASGIPSSGLMRYLIPLLMSPFYFATAENDWADLFHQHLPSWMVVSNPKAVSYFYEKLPDGEAIPWEAWLKPMLAWSAFALVFFFMIICWSVFLRKQWGEHERFSFPLVQLPVDTSLLPIHSESTCFLPNFKILHREAFFRIGMVTPRPTFYLPLRNRRCIPTDT